MPGLTGEVANLIVALKLDDRGFSGKLNAVAGNLKRLDSGFSQMGRGVGQVGAGLARLGTVAAAAAAGGLTAVVTTAASMEEAFIGVQKTVDETANTSFAELRETLRKMSSETGAAFENLSRIGEIGGALGVPIDSLESFIDVVNRLSVSTDLTVDTASTALGQLGTILHLTGEDYRSFADTLVALGNAGASTEPQIVDLAARFAAAGNRAGLSSNEILALASAVTSMGVEVEAGGSALSQTFNNIALAIGTNSDEVKGFTEVLGISAKEFRRRWEQDALGTFQDFLKEIGKLDPIAQAVALDMAGITGTRQLNAVGLMADNFGFLGEQLDVAAQAQGALNEESDKFFASATNQFRRLRENVRLVADTIGTELLPITNELISEFVDNLNNPATQAGLKAFAKDLAGGIRGLVKELKGTDFSGIISGMKLAAEVAKGAFDAFRSLPAPIQQLAIAALVANKVSGGAVGLLAKGLGNIAFGGLKVGGGLVGIFGGRGASPANPMFVAVTNQVPGGGIGAAGAKGGFGSLLFGLGGTVGLGVIIGNVLGQALDALVINKVDPAGSNFRPIAEQSGKFGGLFGLFDPNKAHQFVQDLSRELDIPLEAVERGITDAVNNQGLTFDQAVALLRSIDAKTRTTSPGPGPSFGAGPSTPAKDQLGGPSEGERFTQRLSPEEFIDRLSKTTEIGLKDVGTTIEHGIRTGLDPFGQQMLVLAQQAADPKAPAVFGEISRHIIAAEELQRAYLEAGDANSAREVQVTIDGLHELIGTIDQHNAIRVSEASSADSALRNQVEVARSVADRVRDQRGVLDRGFSAQSGYLSRIAQKDFSPTINLTSVNNVKISTTALQTQINRVRIAGSGSGGFQETSY